MLILGTIAYFTYFHYNETNRLYTQYVLTIDIHKVSLY